jgi:acyl-[acyl carrier protein]--UDP-N-acetylglucosamine O-acyltransferase
MVLYPNAQLAGFISLCRGARVGLGAMVHQRSTIGAGAMVAMGTAVVHDVPPFVLYVNQRCTRLNMHLIKKEFDPHEISAYTAWLKTEYRQRAHNRQGGAAPDTAVPAKEMPEWVVQTAPACFVAVLELFFGERHGERKLAPLADEFI